MLMGQLGIVLERGSRRREPSRNLVGQSLGQRAELAAYVGIQLLAGDVRGDLGRDAGAAPRRPARVREVGPGRTRRAPGRLACISAGATACGRRWAT
jgi:hypothetical protein